MHPLNEYLQSAIALLTLSSSLIEVVGKSFFHTTCRETFGSFETFQVGDLKN